MVKDASRREQLNPVRLSGCGLNRDDLLVSANWRLIMFRPFRCPFSKQDPGSKRRSWHLRLEALEAREMMSYTPSFAPEGKWHSSFCAGTEIPLVGDFNGDRKADIVTFTRGSSGDVFVALSNGTGFSQSVKWHPSFCVNDETPLVGDFNGDGKDDIATFTRGSSGDVFVALSNGSGFGGQLVKWHNRFCVNSEVPLAGDFNGDGKDDIATFTRGSTGDVFVALSSGSSFGEEIKWHDWFCVNSEIPLAGDFNGDRKADLATFTRGSTGDVFVALSDGSRFNGQGVMWHDWFCINWETPLVADFNADGKDDLATFTCDSSGDVFVALSTGDSFNGLAWKWHDSFCYGPDLPAVGDFTGDRKADLARFTRGTTADVYVARSTLQDGANFAVLFSGGVEASQNHKRYYDNIKNLYQTLVAQCNFRPENVYIIYADGTDPADDRNDGKDSDGENIIRNSDMSFAAGATILSATKANLLDTLSEVASDVDSKDYFLFYSFDHGNGTVAQPATIGEEVLCGWGGDIRDDELAPALRDVRGKYNSYVFAQCYAGGMLDDLMPLSPSNAFGCSATNHYEYSYEDGFAAAFVNALKAGHRNTSTLFQLARQNDPYAVQTSYPGNGGTYTNGVEHPWWTGGSFPMFLASANGTTNSAKAAIGKNQPRGGKHPPRNGEALPALAALEFRLLGTRSENPTQPNGVQARKAAEETATRRDALQQTVAAAIPWGISTGNLSRKNGDPAKCSPANSSSRDPLGYLDKECAKAVAVDALFAEDAEFLAGMAGTGW
jgi:hypothetical protein